MLKAKRWTAECNNAVVLAKAIFSGVVTDNLQSFRDFFDPRLGGEGASIGEKYHYHTQRGERNLRNNYKKLLKKITLWKANKPDHTGKGKLLHTRC